jgi:hypothetical protein
MELDERSLVASSTASTHEGTPSEVAHPHGALDGDWDVTRIGASGLTGHRSDRAGGRVHLSERRLCPGPELLSRKLSEQSREGTIENGLVVARGERVPEHVLREPQLLERRATDCELVPVAVSARCATSSAVARRSRAARLLSLATSSSSESRRRHSSNWSRPSGVVSSIGPSFLTRDRKWYQCPNKSEHVPRALECRHHARPRGGRGDVGRADIATRKRAVKRTVGKLSDDGVTRGVNTRRVVSLSPGRPGERTHVTSAAGQREPRRPRQPAFLVSSSACATRRRGFVRTLLDRAPPLA